MPGSDDPLTHHRCGRYCSPTTCRYLAGRISSMGTFDSQGDLGLAGQTAMHRYMEAGGREEGRNDFEEVVRGRVNRDTHWEDHTRGTVDALLAANGSVAVRPGVYPYPPTLNGPGDPNEVQPPAERGRNHGGQQPVPFHGSRYTNEVGFGHTLVGTPPHGIGQPRFSRQGVPQHPVRGPGPTLLRDMTTEERMRHYLAQRAVQERRQAMQQHQQAQGHRGPTLNGATPPRGAHESIRWPQASTMPFSIDESDAESDVDSSSDQE